MSRFITFLFLVLLLNILTIDDCKAQTKSNFEISYLEDVDSKFSLESVKKQHFITTNKKYINLGITKSTLWVKVKIHTKELGSKAVLVVQTPLKDEITVLYSLKNNELIEETLGINYPHSKNKLNHMVPAFEIPISNLKVPILYLKVKSRYSMKVPISIKTKESFNNQRTLEYFLSGLLVGGLFLMGIYNLFLFFSTRDSSYILYIIALFSAILSQGYLFGILIPYVSPESPEFSFRFPIIIMGVTGIFSCWFAIKFLEIKKTSTFFYYSLLTLILLLLFNIVLELLKLDAISRKLNIFLIIVASTFILSSAIYSLIKGKKVALYFTIAWTFYLFGMIVYALQTLSVLPYNAFTEHIMHFGTFLEVVLLSFALGHKYKLVRDEKERLEKQTREELEELVKEQTLELEVALKEKEILLKEIHHRVKNNLQIVISLLDLQVASVKDINNKETLKQSKSRIYSMSLIHQKLYQSDNSSYINLKKYIGELFSYIKSGHEIKSKQTTYSLSIENKDLSLNQTVPLGLIINELLTNSFKYGIKGEKENRIEVTISFRGKDLNLKISDSGEGFSEEKEYLGIKKSLGLFLIKSLTKQLRGSIKRYKADNLFVTEISFPIKDKIEL